MSSAPEYLIARWRKEIPNLFTEEDEDDVLEWLIANHSRKRVILVGSGFSRNAQNTSSSDIPLWNGISQAFARDLGVSPSAFDPLSLADFYRRNFGASALQSRLLRLLDDDALSPGSAHSSLWQSNPEAVVTTNFLDTLLEKNHLAQPVIEDPDLALPIDNLTQVIYLHGHRSNFDSWVVGRSDYDDLPHKRPMLFAKTRQLFAQFPLLVVGYSLTDPDFHMVYRQMVKAMDSRHPLGLAVMLPGYGPSSKRAERAAKQYWRDLGLRIARFKSNVPTTHNVQFSSFFSLTKRLTHPDEASELYKQATHEQDADESFRHNIGVMNSVLEDPLLADARRRFPGSIATLWHEALDSSLPADSQERADSNWQAYNKLRFDLKMTAANGSEDSNIQPPELTASRFVDKQKADALPEALWDIFDNLRHSRLAWKLNELLRLQTSKPCIADWLRAAIKNTSILDSSFETSDVSLTCLFLSSECDDSDRILISERSRSRHPLLADFLSPSVSADGEQTEREHLTVLGKARDATVDERYEDAEALYDRAASAVEAETDEDSALLTYFSRRGVLDAMAAQKDFTAQGRQQLIMAARSSRQASFHPAVSDWLERIDDLKMELYRSSIRRLTADCGRAEYESGRLESSSAPGQLYVIREDAYRLGAPLSTLRDLTDALSGSFETMLDELENRLRLRVAKTGDWLASQIENGRAFFDSGSFTIAKKAGAERRRSGIEGISKTLFPRSTDHVDTMHRRSVVDVLAKAASVLQQQDVPSAISTVTGLSEQRLDISKAEAITQIARICEWKDVSEALLEASAEPGKRDHLLRARSPQRLPWEHWILCDDVLNDGGMELLHNLLGDSGRFARDQVGDVLAQALRKSPSRSDLLELCMRFCKRGLEESDLRSDDLRCMSLFAVTSGDFRNANPQLVERLKSLLEAGNTTVRRQLAFCRTDTELTRSARDRTAQLVNAKDNVIDFEDVLVAAAHIRHTGIIDWAQVSGQLEDSWHGMPSLAVVLDPQLWSSMDWQQIRTMLHVGGHRGYPKSWRLARLRLLHNLSSDDDLASILSDDSESGLGFLRRVATDEFAGGDELLSNHAMYCISTLAKRATMPRDFECIAMVLRASADDPRIGVAHGAAFTSNYLAQDGLAASDSITRAAKDVAEIMRADPLAIVQRQARYGATKGQRDQGRQLSKSS